MAIHRLCIAMVLLTVGCSGPDPVLYTLEAVPGAGRLGAPSVVVVRSVAIPRYLERREIVRIAGQDRVSVADNDWWSEPLPAMLRRVMARDIGQRLPAAEVLAGDGVISLRPDAEIEISIEQFDRAANGRISLEGFVAIENGARSRSLDRIHVELPAGGPSTADQVKVMSLAWSEAADVIARRLSR